VSLSKETLVPLTALRWRPLAAARLITSRNSQPHGFVSTKENFRVGASAEHVRADAAPRARVVTDNVAAAALPLRSSATHPSRRIRRGAAKAGRRQNRGFALNADTKAHGGNRLHLAPPNHECP
jgi:hypothetical protein